MNLLEPFSIDQLRIFWPIMVEGIIVSLSLGLIGCFLVVRGMALLGDALSHSVLPGIVIGFLVSDWLGSASLHSPWILIGATVVGMLAALLVQSVHQHSRVKEDASLGIVFTTMFAIGVVMINLWTGQADLDPGCVLYGNIENFVIDKPGIIPAAIILGLIVLALGLFYRQILVSTFDPALAISLGIPAVLIHYLMMGALSLTVVVSFEAVGAILAVALLVMPGATARLWCDRMPTMLLVSAAHGIVSSVLGYWMSHEAILNTSASGSICVMGFGLFLVSWLIAPKHGLLTQLRTRWHLRRTILMENLIKAIDELSTGADKPSAPRDAVIAELRLPTKIFTKAVNRASSEGWIVQDNGTITLTDSGRAQSRRLIRAHLLWEAFLEQQVGLPPDHVHDAAEWIEHHLDEAQIDRIEKLLDRPTA